jgi:hypothetical protein
MKYIITERQYKVLTEETHVLLEATAQQNIEKVKTEFVRRLDKYVNQYRPALKQASKVVDVFGLVNQGKEYVLNQIVNEYPNIISGKGGDKFAYNVWTYIVGILNSELQKIGWAKKQAIKALAGNKNEFIEKSKRADTEKLYDFLSGVLDIGYIAGSELLDDKKIGDKSVDYSKQYMDWISNNWKKMENSVTNTIANNLYK